MEDHEGPRVISANRFDVIVVNRMLRKLDGLGALVNAEEVGGERVRRGDAVPAQPPALREDSAACTAEELCVAAELVRGL